MRTYVDSILANMRGGASAEFIAKIRDWEHVVFAKSMQNLKDYAARHPIVFKPPFQGSMALKELKQIFTIGPVDRAAHNMALICKRWYLFTLSHELSTKAYAIYTARTKEQILQDHRKWNTAHGLEDEHVDVLPYASGSAKFHK